ncbi:ion channel [Thraustotheca clavata]|uniref:Ion channel n=1 Tax=Thraustotheca clavata TaxID=74557 RepID=A0A1V9Z6X1_9STRA|nr:ion channel [Thraustotheca clavata]
MRRIPSTEELVLGSAEVGEPIGPVDGVDGSKWTILRKRWLYHLDSFISSERGQAIVLVVMCLVIAFGLAPIVVLASNYTYGNAVWKVWLYMADTGTQNLDVYWTERFVALFLAMLGFMYFAVVVGFVVDAIREKMEVLKDGRSQVVELNHTLMLGWSDKSISFLSEVCNANESEGGDADANKSDSNLLRVVLTLRSLRELSGHIVVDVCDGDNESLLKIVGGDVVETVVSHDIMGEMIVMCGQSPGLAKVFSALLGFGGNEFYIAKWPTCTGVAFGDLPERFQDAIPIGIQDVNGKVWIKPEKNRVMQADEGILVLAEDNDTYKAEDPVQIDMGKPVPLESQKSASQTILIAGWRRDIRNMLRLIDNISKPGSVVVLMNEVSIAKREATFVDEGFSVSTLLNIRVEHKVGNPAVRRHLNSLDLTIFDAVMVVADIDREINILDSDSHVLATVLTIRSCEAEQAERKAQKWVTKAIMEGIHAKVPHRQVSCIAEILDSRTQKTIECNHDVGLSSDYIQSNQLISQIIAMVSENRLVKGILDELLGARGASFDVVPSKRYCRRGECLSFFQVVKRAQYVADEIVCGYQRHSSMDAAILNPQKKSLPQEWDEFDFIVLRGGEKQHNVELATMVAKAFKMSLKHRHFREYMKRKSFKRDLPVITESKATEPPQEIFTRTNIATRMYDLWAMTEEISALLRDGSVGTLLICTSNHWESCIWQGPQGKLLKSRELLAEYNEDFSSTQRHMQMLADFHQSKSLSFQIGITKGRSNGGEKVSYVMPTMDDRLEMSSNNTNYLPPLNWCDATKNPLKKNICTPVKSQSNCGSCWAFASVSTIETTAHQLVESIPKLSTQQLLDCSRGEYSAEMQYCWLTSDHEKKAPWLKQQLTWRATNNGCKGGLPFAAFEYVKQHGLVSELQLPYKVSSPLVNTSSCSLSNPLVSLLDWQQAIGPDCSSSFDPNVLLMQYLQRQPLTVSIVSSGLFNSYKSGIYICPNDGLISKTKEIDHAVVLVGYDYDPTLGLYWIVQNSYGEDWGEGGFMRILADSNLNCGLNVLPIAVNVTTHWQSANMQLHIDGNGYPWTFAGLDATGWIIVLVSICLITLVATLYGILFTRYRIAQEQKTSYILVH